MGFESMRIAMGSLRLQQLQSQPLPPAIPTPLGLSESAMAKQFLSSSFSLPRLDQKLKEYDYDLNSVMYYILKGNEEQKIRIVALLSAIYEESNSKGDLLTTNPGLKDQDFDLNQKLKNKKNNGTLYILAAVFALVLLGVAIYFVE